jgi:gluconate kinase
MPAEMLEAIKAGRSFTPAERSAYFELISSRVLQLTHSHTAVIVTQATYKEEHRKLLKQRIPGIGILHIAAPDDLIVARLLQRGDSISPAYAQKIRLNFEAPGSEYPVVHNDLGEERVIAQIMAIYPPK